MRGFFGQRRNKMKVTYYLGAGASHDAIPIVGELEKAFGELKSWINYTNSTNRLQRYRSVETKETYALLNALLDTAIFNAKLYGTIDTFAKKLTIGKNEQDLAMLKAALSYFFSVWQEINFKRINLKSVRENQFKDIDSRYLGLLTNYLNSEEKIKLDDDVKFLSWNYDTQLERALAVITDKSVNSVLDGFGIYPFKKETAPNIIHLNGIAGLYSEKGVVHSLLKEESPLGNSERNVVLKERINFIKAVENREVDVNEYFSFAWENNPTSRQAIEHAEKIMTNTEILVIIGYSFPTFNDQVDKRLIGAAKKSDRLKMVYYQDPNASKEVLNARFGIEEKKIKIIQKTNQFVLPLESSQFEDLDFTMTFA